MKLQFYQSSVTKKIFTASAGLFMIIFLPVHLVTNLLVLPIFPDHEQLFRSVTHFLATFPLIKIIEIVLMASIALHLCYTITLFFKNRSARPIRYKKVKHSEKSPFSRFMIHTGICIGLFLAIHFCNFYFVKLGLIAPPTVAADKEDFYPMILNLFQNKYYCLLYILLLLPTGFHLDHAFQSIFQTFGLSDPSYMKVIQIIGHIFAISITVGFISIPVYFLIF
jgi:succinate dehydrogenase / fumarate reductase cytochrome b subunit